MPNLFILWHPSITATQTVSLGLVMKIFGDSKPVDIDVALKVRPPMNSAFSKKRRTEFSLSLVRKCNRKNRTKIRQRFSFVCLFNSDKILFKYNHLNFILLITTSNRVNNVQCCSLVPEIETFSVDLNS